jgi:hypothetical protein
MEALLFILLFLIGVIFVVLFSCTIACFITKQSLSEFLKFIIQTIKQ